MRIKRVKRITEILLIFLGAALLLVAFYAYELKLDNNSVMGNGRKALALIGAGCLLLAAVSMAAATIRLHNMNRNLAELS